MSATNRGATREKHDYYKTQLYVIENFLSNHKLKSGNILDPAAGCGNFAKVISEQYDTTKCPITNIEIREEEFSNLEGYGETHITNFLDWQSDKKYTTIITNPPYLMAREYIDKCFTLIDKDYEIIMLLRLAFLEGIKRYDFWQEHPVSSVYVLSKRPSFILNDKNKHGTDATSYGFFVWNNNKNQRIVVI